MASHFSGSLWKQAPRGSPPVAGGAEGEAFSAGEARRSSPKASFLFVCLLFTKKTSGMKGDGVTRALTGGRLSSPPSDGKD